MKPRDDAAGIWRCPTTVTHSRAQSRCKTEKFSLPYHNYRSQKYSLQVAPAHRTPYLSDAETWHPPSFLPKTSRRSTPTRPKPWEKGLQDSHKQSREVMSITSLQISWGGKSQKNICIVVSPNQTLKFKVWVRPWMFIHIFVLIQKCEDCTRLTTNRHGLHWNCQSL